jgi:hypothetical protein
MTMLSVVKTVMDSNGWPAPSVGVAGNQDQNMRQSFALINKVLKSVSFKNNWPELVKEYVFTTVPNQAAYPLPADFHHWVVGSAWNKSKYYQLKGTMMPTEWYRVMYGGYGAYAGYWTPWFTSFRIDRLGMNFVVAPTPTAPEDLVFMYVTNNIAMDATGNPKSAYVIDSDIAVIDEEVVELGLSWRWRSKKGLDFTAELAEFNAALKTRFAQYLGPGDIAVGRQVVDYPPLTNGYIGLGPIGGT